MEAEPGHQARRREVAQPDHEERDQGCDGRAEDDQEDHQD